MFECETAHAACPCPLVIERNGLSASDQLCHVPNTRVIFLRSTPNQLCHNGEGCLVCSAYPEQATAEVAAEVAAQELASRAVTPVRQRAQQRRARMSQVTEAMATNNQTNLGNSPGI